MKKLLLIIIALSALNASNDDVSLMDLREATYYLLKDVKLLKEEIANRSNNNKIKSKDLKVTKKEKAIDLNYSTSKVILNYLKSKKNMKGK